MSEDKVYDVVVVGGGPGGLTTGIMCADRKLDVLILEGGTWGGLLATLYPNKVIPNYPGFPDGIVAIELVRRWLKHAKEAKIEMKNERVIEITEDRTIKTQEDNVYKAKVVIIAVGIRPRQLGIPGEMKLNKKDRGVYYYVTHPEDFIGKKVLVVGGGDTAIDAALDLVDLAKEITIIHRKDVFRGVDENVEKMEKTEKITIMMNTELEKIEGKKKVEKVVLWNNKKDETFEMDVDVVVLSVGMVPNTEIFEKIGIKVDKRGYIITDRDQRTSVEGIFAVGDIVEGGFKLIVVGAAHGAVAAHHAYAYINKPYWAGEEQWD
ncbi:MAG: NAD(P)/FAD-dependent oxidoreductase [Candidatus Methanofastidiosia archaeon]|jgi:thioredoxin reductase (NADPH)